MTNQSLTEGLVYDSFKTDLVPGPLEYSILLPNGYSESAAPYPLLLLLHGGGADRTNLEQLRPQIEQLTEDGALPPLIVTTPTVRSGTIYMDDIYGKEKWETCILQEFLPHLLDSFNISSDRTKSAVSGISMGGGGCLRLAFKYPERFGAVASMEPGIWPGLRWDEVPKKHKFRSPEQIAKLFGDPFDHAFWEANHPASIAASNPDRLRDGLAIYLECGALDFFGFHEGTEFLHRTLWENRIPHEYRLVHWANHVGRSLSDRSRNRFHFIGRFLHQPFPEEVRLEAEKKVREEQWKKLGFEPHPFWPKHE